MIVGAQAPSSTTAPTTTTTARATTTSAVQPTTTSTTTSTSTIAPTTTTTAASNVASTITIWHDDTPAFGQLGVPQTFVNVIGNVSDPDGVAQVEYRLRSGAWVAMGLGPDPRRLSNAGDINIDLAVANLNSGNNKLEIRVTDSTGDRTTRTLQVNWTPNRTWALPTTISWSGDLAAKAQPVDGHWRTSGGRLTNIDVEYDRIVVVGDQSWTDYEVEVPVSIGAISPNANESPSNGPGVGIALRWQGHTNTVVPNSQPLVGFLPDGSNNPSFGAILFWRDERMRLPAFEMYDEQNGVMALDRSVTMLQGTDYIFKAQVEGFAPVKYRWKVWKASDPEPTGWMIEQDSTGFATDPRSGSIALIAPELVASFGTVTVRPL